MRIIGALLLTAAASAMGYFKAKELKSQARTLHETISLLELVRNEICTRRTPLKQVFNCTALPDYKYIYEFIKSVQSQLTELGSRSFAQIWCECVEDRLSPLSESNRQALKNIGSSLGKYDAELQATSIDRCISELTAEYKSLNAGLKSNEKMYIGLGTGIGLIFAIILV